MRFFLLRGNCPRPCDPAEARSKSSRRGRRGNSRARTGCHVSSRKCCPAPGGDPIQRAASTRSTCPWANNATSPSAARARAITRSNPCTYLLRRFAARTSILENQPAWRLLMDLLGRQPFILAVVPLGKIGIDDGGVAETRQLAGLPCSLHRTDEDARTPPWRAPGAAFRRADARYRSRAYPLCPYADRSGSTPSRHA